MMPANREIRSILNISTFIVPLLITGTLATLIVSGRMAQLQEWDNMKTFVSMRLPRVRFTVRRLMVYVAVIAVVPHLTISMIIALAPRVEAARRHWGECRHQAFLSNQLAARYRSAASRYPADALIPRLSVRRTEHGPIIPATGQAAAKLASFHAARADLRACEVAPLCRRATGAALAKAVKCG